MYKLTLEDFKMYNELIEIGVLSEEDFCAKTQISIEEYQQLLNEVQKDKN